MRDTDQNIRLFVSARNIYELVFFDATRLWYIRATDKRFGDQVWSESGYDDPREGSRAFHESVIRYRAEAPGRVDTTQLMASWPR